MMTTLLTQLKVILISLAALGASVTPTITSTLDSFNPNQPNVGVSSSTSRNWSGYTATNGTFTSVAGSWTIPSPTGTGHTTVDATWVGIGGVSGTDLIQAGTQDVLLQAIECGRRR